MSYDTIRKQRLANAATAQVVIPPGKYRATIDAGNYAPNRSGKQQVTLVVKIKDLGKPWHNKTKPMFFGLETGAAMVLDQLLDDMGLDMTKIEETAAAWKEVIDALVDRGAVMEVSISPDKKDPNRTWCNYVFGSARLPTSVKKGDKGEDNIVM
jgi:hypothetical protein